MMDWINKCERIGNSIELRKYSMDLGYAGYADLMLYYDEHNNPLKWFLFVNGQNAAEYPASMPIEKVSELATKQVRYVIEASVRYSALKSEVASILHKTK